jgi:hypothetical protein
MSNILVVHMNGTSVVEYDRDKPLAEPQQAYLERMDSKMDLGITLNDEFIISPDPLQRAHFVASQMVQALVMDNEQLIAATCAWLALRVSELKQVRVSDSEGTYTIDLVFDESRVNQVQVALSIPPTSAKTSH